MIERNRNSNHCFTTIITFEAKKKKKLIVFVRQYEMIASSSVLHINYAPRKEKAIRDILASHKSKD
jgi:hypothetical protein